MENNGVGALGKTTVSSACGLRAVPAVRIKKVPLHAV